MKKTEEMTFEEALHALEHSVSTLRSSDASLEGAMHEFEAGMAYYKRCHALLEEAKGTVSLYEKEADALEEFDV